MRIKLLFSSDQLQCATGSKILTEPDRIGIILTGTGRGGGANTKVPDMYGVGWVFSGPKTQK